MRLVVATALLALGCRFHFDGLSNATDATTANDTVDAPDPRVFMYALPRANGDIYIFSVDLATGALADAGMFSLPAIPWFATPGIRGTALYVGSRQTSMLYTLRVDTETGALSLIDQDPTSARPEIGVVHPNGGSLYIADDRLTGAQGVFGYAINADDTLTAISGSPWPHAAVTRTNSVEVHPNGQWLYALSGGVLYGYAIAANGSLAVVPSIAYDTFDAPWDIVIEPSGKFGFVAPDAGPIPGFTINASTGALTTTPGSPFPSGGGTVFEAELTGDGAHLVSASNGSDQVAAYTLDNVTGSLTHLAMSPVATPGTPWGMSASPVGDVFYVADVFMDMILAYRVSGGSLISLGTRPTTPVPEVLTLVRTR